MLFNSWEFLFLFMPLTLVGLNIIHRFGTGPLAPIRWVLLASVFFYGYWNPSYLALLFASILFNFFVAQAIDGGWRLPRRAWTWLGVAVNLFGIVVFKYADFLGENAANILGREYGSLGIVLPLGISFFTFTQTAYLIDVSKGLPAEKSLSHYALFVTVFPHLIAGPIIHYQQVMPQFVTRIFGRITSKSLSYGLTLFVIGLCKKVFLADNLAAFAKPVFLASQMGVDLSYAEAWVGALAYTLQLYFDFSGYSDMAIGLGWTFGLDLPWNFDSPYKARSIQEFWRRWHITLSTFMRDYVYIPLGGSRRSLMRSNLNLLTTMLVCGLWHGASWNFVVWGGMHGLFTIIHRLWKAALGGASSSSPADQASIAGRKGSQLASLLSGALTFLAVTLAWVVFRAPDLATAKLMYHAMAFGNGLVLPERLLSGLGPLGDLLRETGVRPGTLFSQNNVFGMSGLTPNSALMWLAVGMAIVWLLPNSRELMREAANFFAPEEASVNRRATAHDWKWSPSPAWAKVVALLLVLSLMSLSNVSEFLYFQF